MLKIYKDKSKIFKCNVEVEGTKYSDCSVRLFLCIDNSKSFSLIGKIDDNGVCQIDIPKIDFMEEGASGRVFLEVVAESTLFNAWESEYHVIFEKKVSVNVQDDGISNDSNNKSSETDSMKVSVVVDDDMNESLYNREEYEFSNDDDDNDDDGDSSNIIPFKEYIKNIK